MSLTKSEMEQKLQDPTEAANITFDTKSSFNTSAAWVNFRKIKYKEAEQNFVQCIKCNNILTYKSKTGTAGLIRHKCAVIPVHVDPFIQENIKIEYVEQGEEPSPKVPSPRARLPPYSTQTVTNRGRRKVRSPANREAALLRTTEEQTKILKSIDNNFQRLVSIMETIASALTEQK